MKKKGMVFLLVFWLSVGWARADCINAIPLSQTAAYCSPAGAFDNTNTEKTTWFKFTASAFDVTVTASGLGVAGTLPDPVINIYSDCAGTNLVGTAFSARNVTSFYKGGLIIGRTYYIAVSGGTAVAGTFQLCLNNYNPVLQAGQDCATASFLCSTQTISQNNVSGAGANNNEAVGTCLSVAGLASESNSTWYKWQAANNGTLVFTLTPSNVKDDLDWVLYDLGVSSDCAGVNAANAIRCQAGYGIDNKDCPGAPTYYKTGLDFAELDLTEEAGCGKGQNGKLKFVDLEQGHYYALLVNNFSSGNNGFTLAFTDQTGTPGTALFSGPRSVILSDVSAACTAAQAYTFSSGSSNYASLSWTFGEGASVPSATTEGPHLVTYRTPGLKTVTLTAQAAGGCQVVATQQVTVGLKPALPQIVVSQPAFCLADTIVLSAGQPPGALYQWSGPNNFRSALPVVRIPVSGPEVSGTYTLLVTDNGCSSDLATVTIAAPLPSPTAGFYTDPAITRAEYGPLAVQFRNTSVGADSYLWDFGDGSSATAVNPTHTYAGKGTYTVRLTAFKSNACSASLVSGQLVVILKDVFVFIPNIFSPNGDGVNDAFKVIITNIKRYHIRIYNRWGQSLFESGDISKSWDGTYQGSALPYGAYYYEIKAIGTNDQNIVRGGSVTLVK